MREKTSGFGPSLIELVVAVLLFSLAAAACVKIFVSAKLISDDGARLSGAITVAQSSAECFKAYGGNVDEVSNMLGGTSNSNGFEISYDRNWKQTDRNGKYILCAEVTTEGFLRLCKITVKSGDDDIYSISVASHGEAAS